MKKVAIDGIAKVEAYKSKDGNYSSVEVNGIKLEELLAENLLQKPPDGDSVRETGLCKITITIEPYPVDLRVNGQNLPLEL